LEVEGVPPEAAANLGAMMMNGAGEATAAAMVEVLRNIHTENFGNDSPQIPLTMLFPERCREPVFGLDMFDLLGRSKIVFNRHTDALARPAFGNIRAFEATGMGSCLLTDFTEDGRALFEPDSEIVTYASIDEAIEKAAYLRDHEADRAAIAEAGHARTLSSHTMAHRCEQIHGIIVDALGGDTSQRTAI